MATFEDFKKIDIRVGKVLEVEDFPEAIKPAYKLKIDFGSQIGTRVSSVQLPQNYSKGELKGRLVLGVVNFSRKKIGPFYSEVLTLGVPDAKSEVILIKPDNDVPLGARLY